MGSSAMRQDALTVVRLGYLIEAGYDSWNAQRVVVTWRKVPRVIAIWGNGSLKDSLRMRIMDFNTLAGIYTYAMDHHNGQWSRLYRLMSRIRFNAPDHVFTAIQGKPSLS